MNLLLVALPFSDCLEQHLHPELQRLGLMGYMGHMGDLLRWPL